ncbi:Uncharacterised protein [Chlamydia abortus]|nr:Uncharacterised protein [Chlamydia abortus]
MGFADVIVDPVRVNRAGLVSAFARILLLIFSNEKSSCALLSVLSFIFF